MFDTGTQCPKTDSSQDREVPTSSGSPDTRSPLDCWHSEQYLIGWLVKCWGWRMVEPGKLVRPPRKRGQYGPALAGPWNQQQEGQ